eukprot:6491455-Amphidinium_carterae.3
MQHTNMCTDFTSHPKLHDNTQCTTQQLYVHYRLCLSYSNDYVCRARNVPQRTGLTATISRSDMQPFVYRVPPVSGASSTMFISVLAMFHYYYRPRQHMQQTPGMPFGAPARRPGQRANLR